MSEEVKAAETLADKASEILTNFVNETVGDTNATVKEPATPEGQVIQPFLW